jgi:hypothetical protein
MKKLLLFATCLYLLLASLTYHPDNKLVLNWASQNNGKVWNIWSYGEKNLQKVGQFNYPPLHFYLDKIQYAVAKPIGGPGFYEWLSSPNSTDHNQVNLARYSFAIKTPLILFALLAAYLLFLIAKQFKASDKQALIISALWLFNPVIIYSVPVMGQNDVMAIVFFLAGWYYLNKQKTFSSSLFFGLGASIKMFPLLWLPFLLFVDNRLTVKNRIKIFIYSVSIYVLTLLPFISNSVFRANAFNSGIDRLFIARLNLGFSDEILIVPILLMILVFITWNNLDKVKKTAIIGIQSNLLLLFNILLLFFNHFHPQWFSWLIPFWAIWLVICEKKQFKNRLIISISVFFAWLLIILLFNDSALTFGLLTSLNPNLAVLPTLRDLLLNRHYQVELWNNYAHTWLSGIALIFLIIWAKNKTFAEEIGSFVDQYKLFKYKKIVYYLISLISGVVITFSIIFLAKIIPAPITGPSPYIVEYPFFTKSVSRKITTQYDGLNRIDLYFSNQELKNKDPYLLIINDEQNLEIWRQEFSGLNAGYESSIRFDLPIQTQSKNKIYSITVTPLLESEEPLRIGSLEKDNPQAFAIRSQYKKPSGLSYLIKESLATAKQTFQQLPGLYLALPILLWLAL